MRKTIFRGLACLAFINVSAVTSLDCYACDNQASGLFCADSPETLENGQVPCRYDYCFITRTEQTGRTATVNRGCCRVENNSPSCPPGPLFQSQTDEDAGWTIYYTRCDTDLCNDGDGLGDNDDSSGGVLVVDGVPEGTYSRGERIFQGLGVSLSSFIALFSVRRIFRVATM